MRTLTANATTAKNARNATPRYVVKIEFGGAVGTKYYSSVALGAGDGSSLLNAAARVMSWDKIDAAWADDKRNPVSDLSLSLKDADHVLAGYHDAVEWQGKRVTVYLYFDGLQAADAVVVLGGAIAEPIRWDWAKGEVSLDVTDVSTAHRTIIGHVADRDEFPSVAAEDEGRAIPLVFGRVSHVPLLYARSGLATRLIRPCGPTDAKLFVEDAEDMPQDTLIYLFVERELVRGSFHGNTFTVTQRGAALASSTTTANPPAHPVWGREPWTLIDTSIGGMAPDWMLYNLEIHDPDGAAKFPTIIAYDPATGRFRYSPVIYHDFAPWWVPAGTPYRIISLPWSHVAGVAVVRRQVNYVYIANDAPSKRVRSVFGFGPIAANAGWQVAPGVTQSAAFEVQAWIPILPDLYTVKRNDSTTFPGLGRAITTITLKRPVTQYYPKLRDARLWADVEGVEDLGNGAGALIANPASVLRELLVRWMGLGAADVDTASFLAARAALDYLKFGFALDREWDGAELVADLAFQARCALLWDDGRARLKVLRNVIESPVATITSAKRSIEILDVLRTKREDVVSRVTAAYRRADAEAKVAVEDPAVAAWQDKNWDIALFAYSNRANAVSVANFWLQRRKRVYEIAKLRVFLRGLELQRLDSIALDLPDFFDGVPRAIVTDIGHDLGHAGQRLTEIELTARILTESSCELGESGEPVACWACETSCQAACELFCMSSVEIYCQAGDTDGGGGGQCAGCEAGCQAACETACQGAACETACQVGCEASCQTGCEGGCQTSCVTDCQVSCTAGCQAGCETGCESACEAACQATCETDCQSGCEVSCETDCQTDCQVSCESVCEATCEALCESGCETSCETGCEAACQSGCELSCESGCELSCESGCEVSCQSGCELSCESGCEVSCQSGCELSCESGCEVACQSGCELSCESGCEVSCESGCETSCETGCETSEEAACAFADDFARANGPVGNGWAQASDTYGGPVVISGGRAEFPLVHAQRAVLAHALAADPATACSVNHYCQAEVGRILDANYSGAGVSVRADGAANTRYNLYMWTSHSGAQGACSLTRIANGSITYLGSGYESGLSTATLKISANAGGANPTTVLGYVNGVQREKLVAIDQPIYPVSYTFGPPIVVSVQGGGLTTWEDDPNATFYSEDYPYGNNPPTEYVHNYGAFNILPDWNNHAWSLQYTTGEEVFWTNDTNGPYPPTTGWQVGEYGTAPAPTVFVLGRVKVAIEGLTQTNGRPWIDNVVAGEL